MVSGKNIIIFLTDSLFFNTFALRFNDAESTLYKDNIQLDQKQEKTIDNLQFTGMTADIVRRIVEILQYKELTYEKLGKSIGVTKAAVSLWIVGRTLPTERYVIKILQAYPDINANWFLFGEQSMLKKDSLSADGRLGEVMKTLEEKEKELIYLRQRIEDLKELNAAYKSLADFKP